jgi:hypothetical protein
VQNGQLRGPQQEERALQVVQAHRPGVEGEQPGRGQRGQVEVDAVRGPAAGVRPQPGDGRDRDAGVGREHRQSQQRVGQLGGERVERDAQGAERVGVGMVAVDVLGPAQRLGDVPPGAPAADRGGQQGHSEGCAAHRVDGRGGVGRQVGRIDPEHGGGERRGGLGTEHVDRVDPGPHRGQHLRVPGREQHPAARPGQQEAVRGGVGPDVVDDQQDTAVGEQLAQPGGHPGRAGRRRSLVEPGQQPELDGEDVGLLADVHPVHAVREPSAHVRVAGEGRGQYRLADPAGPAQPDRGRGLGHADRAGVVGQHGLDQAGQLVAPQVAGGQAGHAVQLAGHRAGGHRAGRDLGRRPRRRRRRARHRRTRREHVDQPGADPGDQRVQRARNRLGRGQRPGGRRVVQPLHVGQVREVSPQAVADQHGGQSHTVPLERGQLHIQHEVRIQQGRAHQHQRRSAAPDGRVDLRAPALPGADVDVGPQPQPAPAQQRPQHHLEPLDPHRVRVAVADEQQAPIGGPSPVRSGSHRLISAARRLRVTPPFRTPHQAARHHARTASRLR